MLLFKKGDVTQREAEQQEAVFSTAESIESSQHTAQLKMLLALEDYALMWGETIKGYDEMKRTLKDRPWLSCPCKQSFWC